MKNTVGMFFPVEVIQNVESILIHFELLVLSKQVRRVLAENSFFFIWRIRLRLSIGLLDVKVRAEEVFTVFFFVT